jgi:hypothetical protein
MMGFLKFFFQKLENRIHFWKINKNKNHFVDVEN